MFPRFEAKSQEPLPFAQAGHVDEPDTGPSSAKRRRRGPRPPPTRRLQRSLLIRRQSQSGAGHPGANANQHVVTVAHHVGRQFQSAHGGLFQEGGRPKVRRTRSVEQVDQRVADPDVDGRQRRVGERGRREQHGRAIRRLFHSAERDDRHRLLAAHSQRPDIRRRLLPARQAADGVEATPGERHDPLGQRERRGGKSRLVDGVVVEVV